MIRHMFKLMWNRKRRNLLLIIEMLVSFLVLFAITSTLFGWGLQYLEPRGFNPDDVWVVQVQWQNKVQGQTQDEVRQLLVRLEQEAGSFSEVSGVCWGFSNTPYSGSTWTSGITWNGQSVHYHYIMASDSYAEVLEIPLAEGQWYGPEHDATSIPPVVINEKLRDILFGPDGDALGKTISDEDSEYFITGVVDNFRYKGELDNQHPVLFERVNPADTAFDPPTRLLVKVQEGTGVSFEKTLTEYLSQVVPDWTLRVENISDMRSNYFSTRYMMLLTPGILGGFLVFNVALGLFGILWYSINRRRSELGLRRALGARSEHVNLQIIGEALVIVTFAIVVGVVLAAHAPILNIMGSSVSTSAYLLAIVASAILIYVLVVICAWYPAQLAARIQPADALRDE